MVINLIQKMIQQLVCQRRHHCRVAVCPVRGRSPEVWLSMGGSQALALHGFPKQLPGSQSQIIKDQSLGKQSPVSGNRFHKMQTNIAMS